MNDKPKSDKSSFEAATGTVCGLIFRGEDFRSVQAPEEVTFSDCDFSQADFSGVDLSGLTFERCVFRQTKFIKSTIIGCSFIGDCDLYGADLRSADATSADFSNSNMEKVTATAAKFYKSIFTNATLSLSIFDRADLGDAVNFAPDQTSVYGAVFSGDKIDKWTSLRFEYTGLKLVLSLVPAIIFMLSLLTEAYASLAMNYYLANAGDSSLCGQDGSLCKEYAVWQVLLGFREGWLATAFIIYSAIYNLLRFWLTMKISSLAKSEDRSRITPRLGGTLGYRNLHRVSIFIQIAKYGMLILFVFNMWGLIEQTVLLPKE